MLTDFLGSIGRFFAALGHFLGALWWKLENLVVIQPIEFVARA